MSQSYVLIMGRKIKIYEKLNEYIDRKNIYFKPAW